MKEISENLKLVFTSSLPLVVTISLFLLVGSFGTSKAKEVRVKINQANLDQNVLSQKVALLQSLKGTIQDFSSEATVALPDANTSLAVISQLKNLSFANALVLGNIKGGVGVKDASGLSRVDISFDIGGSRSQIVSFLEQIVKLAPIMVVDKVKIVESGGIAKANVSVKSFWAALPKSLPGVNQPLADLTSDEKDTLAVIGNLTQPIFTEIPPASGGKVEPFGQ